MSAAQPIGEPGTPLASVLATALAQLAAERPDLAAQLPWRAVTDPEPVGDLAAIDAETARLRAALKAGASPEELGLVEGGLEQILRERGLA
jgi:hypothetical protein